MSVQTEITRIAQAKTDIKNVVNSKVANTITNQTIDAFPPLIDSSIAAYKNLIPWIEGSGSSFTIDNAEAGKLDKFEMYGNTHQDSYTGKNLLPITNQDVTIKGVNFKAQNGSIKINGTAGDNISGIDLKNNNVFPLTLSAGTYYLTRKSINSNVTINIVNQNNEAIAVLARTDTTYSTTFTLNATETVYLGFFIPSGSVITNYIGEIMVSTSGGDYEPFVGGSPSPSPDYPQPIEVVTGDNTIKVEGKNLLNDYDLINRYNIASISDNILTTNAINSDYSVFQPRTKTQKIDLVENTKYYVSFDCRLKSGTYSSKLGTNIINGIDATSYSTGNTAISNPNMSSLYQRYSFECISNITTNSVLGIQIQVRTGLSNAVFEIKNIMITTSSNNSYEPYQSQSYPINLGDIELCKIGDYQDYIYKENNKWYKHSEIGKVVLDGSENWFTQKSTSPYVFALNFDNYKRTQENICKCNLFSSVTNGGYGDLTDGQICFRYNSGDTNKNLYVCTTVASTINDFKTWLSTHNLIVYYILATPTNTEITDTELISQLNAIETYTGTNIFSVSNSNGVLPDLYVLTEKQNSYKN